MKPHKFKLFKKNHQEYVAARAKVFSLDDAGLNSAQIAFKVAEYRERLDMGQMQKFIGSNEKIINKLLTSFVIAEGIAACPALIAKMGLKEKAMFKLSLKFFRLFVQFHK